MAAHSLLDFDPKGRRRNRDLGQYWGHFPDVLADCGGPIRICLRCQHALPDGTTWCFTCGSLRQMMGARDEYLNKLTAGDILIDDLPKSRNIPMWQLTTKGVDHILAGGAIPEEMGGDDASGVASSSSTDLVRILDPSHPAMVVAGISNPRDLDAMLGMEARPKKARTKEREPWRKEAMESRIADTDTLFLLTWQRFIRGGSDVASSVKRLGELGYPWAHAASVSGFHKFQLHVKDWIKKEKYRSKFPYSRMLDQAKDTGVFGDNVPNPGDYCLH